MHTSYLLRTSVVLLAAAALAGPSAARAADGKGGGFGSILSNPSKAAAKADSQFAVARICERRGETAKAQDLYAELAKKSTPKVQAGSLHRLGVLAAKAGKLPAADIYFKQAIAITPDAPQLLGDMGYCAYLQGRHAEAVSHYRKALEKDAKNLTLKNNLGLALGRSGKYAEAFEQFRQAGGEAQANSNLAFVHAQAGNADAAEVRYGRALTLNNKLRPAAEGLVQVARYKEEQPAKVSDRQAEQTKKKPQEEAREAKPTVSRAVPASHVVPIDEAGDDAIALVADDPPAPRGAVVPQTLQNFVPAEAAPVRSAPARSPSRSTQAARPQKQPGLSAEPIVRAPKAGEPSRIKIRVDESPAAAPLELPALSPVQAKKSQSRAAPPADSTSAPTSVKPAGSAAKKPPLKEIGKNPAIKPAAEAAGQARSSWPGSFGASHVTSEETGRKRSVQDTAASLPLADRPNRPAPKPRAATSSRTAANGPIEQASSEARPKSLEELMTSMQTAEKEAQPAPLPAVVYERKPTKNVQAALTQPAASGAADLAEQSGQQPSAPAQAQKKSGFPQLRVPLMARSEKSKSSASNASGETLASASESDSEEPRAGRAEASQGVKSQSRQTSSLPAVRKNHTDTLDRSTANTDQSPTAKKATRTPPSGIDRARSWLDKVIMGD